jgi:hypothetical protein
MLQTMFVSRRARRRFGRRMTRRSRPRPPIAGIETLEARCLLSEASWRGRHTGYRLRCSHRGRPCSRCPAGSSSLAGGLSGVLA